MGSKTSKKPPSAFQQYVGQLREYIESGEASEHTYRGALETFIRSFGNDITVTNEPSRKRSSNKSNNLNKVDLIIRKHKTPIGSIEAKDVGESLNDVESGEQIARYVEEFPNLILTDYVEFRRYVKGQKRVPVRIGKIKGKALEVNSKAETELNEFFADFLTEESFTVTSSIELAALLASHAKQIKKLVKKELTVEEDSQALHNLMKAFKDVLIKNLDENKFSDMLAQTLVYGLFAARVHHDGKSEFSRLTAGQILPPTNKFLRKLFTAFMNDHLPKSVASVADEVISLLHKTDIDAILKEFSNQGKEDAVIYFYEAFLRAYDPNLQKEMGVYYTPDPVVDYMVRAVDCVLTEKFGRKKGLADENTLILDPALGTGSYLKKVIQHISAKIPEGKWDNYVSENLLNRIFGFEILMAPYSIAHLKLGLQLRDSGYQFDRDKRLGVYLTDTLEETAKKSEALFGDWISEEANAAAKVKRDSIMVVLGNPPYSGDSQNNGDWIRKLMRGFDTISDSKCADYYSCDGGPIGEKYVRFLNDDYVKFIRFGHWRVEQTGHGILAFITNHGYLDNPTFKGMRQALMQDFDSIYVLDLHGNAKKKEVSPDGTVDENVFDIQTGVSICFLIRDEKRQKGLAKVYHADLFGTREHKYEWLRSKTFANTGFKLVNPSSPHYLFAKQDVDRREEFSLGIDINELFEDSSVGIQSSSDNVSIQFSSAAMKSVASEVSNLTERELEEKYALPAFSDNWSFEKAKKDIAAFPISNSRIKKILYRPFDWRFTYWTGKSCGLHWRPRTKIMEAFLSDNDTIGICLGRAGSATGGAEWNLVSVTDSLVDLNLFRRGGAVVFPSKISKKGKVSSNIKLADLPFESGDDLIAYLYAILNSNSYRERYREFLLREFPKIQVCPDAKLRNKLINLGQELIALHLMKSSKVEGGTAVFAKKGSDVVEECRYLSSGKRLYINRDQYFENVPENIFKYESGGYKVLEKWLKDRKGCKLTFEDKNHFETIIASIERTFIIVSKIEDVIDQAGGWPLVSSKKAKKAA